VLTTWLLDCARPRRELWHDHNGPCPRGTVSASPTPGPYQPSSRAGQAVGAELIADIKEGFYVTELMGSGVNGVTGDYSRGAAGFWIENGKLDVCGQRK
jgi:PmbA protein